MAVNNALIQGAAIAAPRFTDVGGAFSAGVNSSIAGQGVPTSSKKRDKINEVNTTVKGYIDSLNSEMDLVGLSQDEQNSIRGYLFNKKMEYSNLANQIAQIDATSPYYTELKNKMDGIKTSFYTLANQVNGFKERKAQYLDDFNAGRLSKGNNPEAYEKAANVYGGGALSIDPNGELYIITNGGNDFVRYSEIKDPFLKDFNIATKIAEQSNNLYKAGMPLDGPKEMLLRNGLISMLSEDGALESAVEDGLISGKPLDVDLDAYENREQAIEAVANLFLQGYRDTAKAGAREKEARINKNKPTPSATTANMPDVDLSKRTGYSEEDRKIFYNKALNLEPDQVLNIPNFSGSNDPAARRGYGQVDYTIAKAKDGNYVFVGKDSNGEIWSQGIMSKEELQKELLGEATATPTAEELMKKYGKKE